jgi:hypothetical protein
MQAFVTKKKVSEKKHQVQCQHGGNFGVLLILLNAYINAACE